MKNILVILSLLFSAGQVFSTGQKPDYLIIGNDTIPIFSNPLNQYLKNNNIDFEKEIIEPYSIVKNSDGTTIEYFSGSNCWRAYVAYWEIENDSLKLIRIEDCCKCIPLNSEQIIFKIFGHNNVFADWYTGTITIPRGNLFSGSSMGYNAIYEFEDKIEIENGSVKGKYQVSNLERIEQIKLENKLYSHIAELKDTLLYYLVNGIDWDKIDDSNFDCGDSYLISYDEDGNLKSVKLIPFHNDSTTLNEKIYDWRLNNKCSKKIIRAIKGFSLSYINPHRDFIVEIDLHYNDKLEIWKCHHYFRAYTEDEISEWIKEQMNVKE